VKNGIVTNGRTTTYYGNAANRAMAQMSLQYAASQEEVDEKILKAVGAYQLALVEVAPLLNFKVSKELLAQVEKKQAEYAKEQEDLRINNLKKKFLTKPVKVAKRLLSKNCELCKQPIAPLQGYRDLSSIKAHSACVDNPRTGT
jgi:hypothetical protein